MGPKGGSDGVEATRLRSSFGRVPSTDVVKRRMSQSNVLEDRVVGHAQAWEEANQFTFRIQPDQVRAQKIAQVTGG